MFPTSRSGEARRLAGTKDKRKEPQAERRPLSHADSRRAERRQRSRRLLLPQPQAGLIVLQSSPPLATWTLVVGAALAHWYYHDWREDDDSVSEYSSCSSAVCGDSDS